MDQQILKEGLSAASVLTLNSATVQSNSKRRQALIMMVPLALTGEKKQEAASNDLAFLPGFCPAV